MAALRVVAAIALATLAAACGPPRVAPSRSGPKAPAAAPTPTRQPAKIVGRFDRAAIEKAMPEWNLGSGEARVDSEAAAALLLVPAGPRVIVVLGSWCSDSRRELSRLWQAFDLAGGAPLFEVVYVFASRAKDEPAEWIGGKDIRFVPTFIVEREGREVGRIVESAPRGIERELLDLVTGVTTGIVSERTDLTP